MTEHAIHDWPLPYVEQLPHRPADTIDLVVVHCTELPDLAIAREYGERVLYGDGTGNTGHFYIDRDGSIHRFASPNRITHHTRGYNDRSIGIELVNHGRYPDWFDSRHQRMREPYTPAQLRSLTALLAVLQEEIPTLKFIAGHEDLDRGRVPASDDPSVTVWRKRDPGPQFPWQQLLAACPLQRIQTELAEDGPG